MQLGSLMIKVKKRKDVTAYPSLQDNVVYYIDVNSVQIDIYNKNNSDIIAVADVYTTISKEGRIGMVPVNWFQKAI